MRRWIVCAGAFALAAVLGFGCAAAGEAQEGAMIMTVTPAAAGLQLVRTSLPLPKGALLVGQALVASDGQHQTMAAVRPLTWHPEPRSVRRALATFPYTFTSMSPVRFTLKATASPPPTAARFPADVKVDGETVTIAYQGGPALTARLLAPARSAIEPARTEEVESNACFSWRRVHLPDPAWPRIIEVRADALGTVAVVAHVQRSLPGDPSIKTQGRPEPLSKGDERAPDLGWEIELSASPCRLLEGEKESPVANGTSAHAFADGSPCACLFENGRYRLYHPAAALKRRGRVEVSAAGAKNTVYRYWRCKAEDEVPMQQAAWQRVEFVVAPSSLASLTATLESPHAVLLDWRAWDELYGSGAPLDLKDQPELLAVLNYHHQAIARTMALGDDWGNVTYYNDRGKFGPPLGMNRLNHCPAIFQEAYRSGDRRLLDAAVLWCDNFYDQTIWWGPGNTGGTRYNNAARLNKPVPDKLYMWRSDNAVDFCTKGFDSFFYTYEQTGDPRMMEALEAQTRYAAEHIHIDRGQCRDIGVVAEFIRLYRFTGRPEYLEEALRLFRELRTKLSPGDLFSQGGPPIVPDPPFINDDDHGYKHPFAKPYIIGYALAGLPELARYAPDEPKLRDVVQAVANFLAESQDPIGGWRYPHPRSSAVSLSQAIEHAWQLVQADKRLGPQEPHLDAIERVLRQRILFWRKTGMIFSGIGNWELATGKVKQVSGLYQLYKKPADRDCARDYTEGKIEFVGSPPEGLVYFPEVLAFYLEHRPASRLLAPAKADEPLGKALARVPAPK